MTEGCAYSVGDVGFPRRATSGDQPGHHSLDLLLLSPAVSGHRLLDRRGAVLKDPQSGRTQRSEDDAARVGELQRRTCADPVEWRLDRGDRWPMLLDDGCDLGMEAREAIRQRHFLREPDLSTGDQLGRVARPGDDGPPGASGSRVDAQDPADFRQDAASETASASNERLA
jgi:hypothetical protein